MVQAGLAPCLDHGVLISAQVHHGDDLLRRGARVLWQELRKSPPCTRPCVSRAGRPWAHGRCSQAVTLAGDGSGSAVAAAMVASGRQVWRNFRQPLRRTVRGWSQHVPCRIKSETLSNRCASDLRTWLPNSRPGGNREGQHGGLIPQLLRSGGSGSPTWSPAPAPSPGWARLLAPHMTKMEHYKMIWQVFSDRIGIEPPPRLSRRWAGGQPLGGSAPKAPAARGGPRPAEPCWADALRRWAPPHTVVQQRRGIKRDGCAKYLRAPRAGTEVGWRAQSAPPRQRLHRKQGSRGTKEKEGLRQRAGGRPLTCPTAGGSQGQGPPRPRTRATQPG